ncbi:MAG: hypothetical protein ACE5IZ_00290, partial [Dehalococcoidia bacterium]
SGGRYDRLIALVGDADTPATGFALDVDAVLSLLPGDDLWRQVVTVVAGETTPALAATFRTARALQQAGVMATVASRPAVGGGRWELRLEATDKGWDYLLRDGYGGGEHRFHDVGSLLNVVRGDVGD